MGEFFKGWRCKAGLVTLGIALPLMAAWMRSYMKIDVISVGVKPTCYMAYSASGQLRWGRGTQNWPTMSPKWNSVDMAKKQDFGCILDVHNVQWRWKWGEFQYGKCWHDQWLVESWTVPYWSLLLPLTLLSGWLILGKPRKAKSATGSTP